MRIYYILVFSNFMNVSNLDNLIEVDYSNHLIYLQELKFYHFLEGQKQIGLTAYSFYI